MRKNNKRKPAKKTPPRIGKRKPKHYPARVGPMQFLRTTEVAQALGLYKKTVQRYIRLGVIPATRRVVDGRKPGYWMIDPAWVAERQAQGWPYRHYGPKGPGRPRSFPLPTDTRTLELPYPKQRA